MQGFQDNRVSLGDLDLWDPKGSLCWVLQATLEFQDHLAHQAMAAPGHQDPRDSLDPLQDMVQL